MLQANRVLVDERASERTLVRGEESTFTVVCTDVQVEVVVTLTIVGECSDGYIPSAKPFRLWCTVILRCRCCITAAKIQRGKGEM